MPRRANPQRIKTHRPYTIEELAQCLRVNSSTVAEWIKEGLQTACDTRPVLIEGREAKAFLQQQKKSNHVPLKPGEMRCMPCRASKRPAYGMVDVIKADESTVRLRGMCPDCGTFMHRTVKEKDLDEIAKDCDLSWPES